MEFILNECSLNRQYSSMDEFVGDLGNVVGCINIIRKNPVNTISKVNNFYESMVTEQEHIYDLKNRISEDDELKSFQLSLDAEVYDRPHWDDECVQNLESSYWWNDRNVSLTGMAEAAATSNQLLSFRMDGLVDRKIDIKETTSDGKQNMFDVDSVFSVKYLIRKYGDKLGISRDDILIERYRGTRVDYSTIEHEFGADSLEENEYKLVRGTLDKVVQHESFETMATPIILYEYQRTRKADHPEEFLKDYKGIVVCDGYSAYRKLDRETPDIIFRRWRGSDGQQCYRECIA